MGKGKIVQVFISFYHKQLTIRAYLSNVMILWRNELAVILDIIETTQSSASFKDCQAMFVIENLPVLIFRPITWYTDKAFSNTFSLMVDEHAFVILGLYHSYAIDEGEGPFVPIKYSVTLTVDVKGSCAVNQTAETFREFRFLIFLADSVIIPTCTLVLGQNMTLHVGNIIFSFNDDGKVAIDFLEDVNAVFWQILDRFIFPRKIDAGLVVYNVAFCVDVQVVSISVAAKSNTVFKRIDFIISLCDISKCLCQFYNFELARLFATA